MAPRFPLFECLHVKGHEMTNYKIDPDTLAWIREAIATAADMLKRDDSQTRRMVAADLACAAIELKNLEVSNA